MDESLLRKKCLCSLLSQVSLRLGEDQKKTQAIHCVLTAFSRGHRPCLAKPKERPGTWYQGFHQSQKTSSGEGEVEN